MTPGLGLEGNCGAHIVGALERDVLEVRTATQLDVVQCVASCVHYIHSLHPLITSTRLTIRL